MNLVPSNASVTMTSLDLVEFINSQRGEDAPILAHSDFLKKVPQVLGEIGAGNFSFTYRDVQNKERPCYKFPKREACLMAMSYSYELQAKVFDKMTELEETAHRPQLPDFTNPAVAARAWADQVEARQLIEAKTVELEHKVEVLAPKAEALDRMALADGEVCLQTAGKLLQQPPNKFIAWLRSLGTWIFKRQGSSRNSAYTDKINAGYLNVRTVTTILPDGSERVTEQVVVTPKGLAKLAQMLGVTPIGGAA